MEDFGGRLELWGPGYEESTLVSVALMYTLERPFSGRPNFFVLGPETPVELREREIKWPRLRSLTSITVHVDLEDWIVIRTTDGIGTEWAEPQPGDELPSWDGTVFVITEDNYDYDEASGTFGLPDAELPPDFVPN